MDRLVYTAMTGAKHILEQQATNSHNLANATTTGFRAQLADCSITHASQAQCLPALCQRCTGFIMHAFGFKVAALRDNAVFQ